MFAEHTLLVTEEGVEVLTARLPDSPGGPAEMPSSKKEETTAKESAPAVNGS